jgi:hypothetical protein
LGPFTVVKECVSLLVINHEMVSVVHKSARDYLIYHRASLQGGTIQGHADIARVSIVAISSTFKRDTYDLRQYGFKPKDLKPPNPDPLAPIAYCCVFWADHFCAGDNATDQRSTDSAKVGVTKAYHFLKRRLLYWVESVTLLGKLEVAVLSIRKVLRVTEVCSAETTVVLLEY